MAFSKDNYWGGGHRTPSTDAQIKISPWNKSGLTDAELDELTKSMADPSKLKQMGDSVAGGFVKDLEQRTAGLNIGMGLPSVPDMGIRPTGKPAADTGGPSLGDTFSAGAAGAASDAFGGIGDIAKSIFGGDGGSSSLFGAAPPQESPEELYARLRKASGEYTYNGPSAADMVKKEYDPQFALLDQLGKQTTERYDRNKADITQMYAGLVNDATASRGADQKAYADASDKTGQNYADAATGLTKSSTAYSTAMAQELARLGVKEGLGNVVGDVGKNLQDNVGSLEKQGANQQGLLDGLGANEYAYDTRNIGVTKQAGIQTQEQFLNDYMGRMDQNDNQRLQLTGQQGHAQNAYDMQIQDLLQKGRASWEDSILGQFKGITDVQQHQNDDFYKQAGLDLQGAQFQFQKDQADIKNQQANQPKPTTLNPYDALQQRALTQYADPVKARQVVDQIMTAYQQNPNPKSVGDFLNGLDPAVLHGDPAMTSLIYDFVSRLLPKP